jgi:hypothetical protein
MSPATYLIARFATAMRVSPFGSLAFMLLEARAAILLQRSHRVRLCLTDTAHVHRQLSPSSTRNGETESRCCRGYVVDLGSAHNQ